MQADLVLYNGDIHTMDQQVPRARALAVAGNRVLATGDDAAMRGLLGPGGRAQDLAGRTVLPGLIDSHLHFLSYGLSLRQIDLAGVPSLVSALARVAERAAVTAPGIWLQGRGWDNTLWQDQSYPAAAHLDRVAPDHPVFLKRKCGHIAWANTRALALAGIGATTPDPEGGEIERDPTTGQPTGILKERAADLILSRIGEPSPAEAESALRAAMTGALRAGLTSVHSMEGPDALRACQRLATAGELRVRVLMQVPEPNLEAAVALGLRSGFGDNWLRIGGVKLFADGSLGGRTALMLQPYDDSEQCGIAVTGADELRALVSRAARAGLACFVHAIGDGANRSVLDAIEATRQIEIEAGLVPPSGEGRGRLRHRIEHVQVLHPADIPRLARLDVVASMQPIHCTQDMLMAEPRWGSRCAGAYAWRSLLDAGAALAFGSDAPVEDLNVMKGIQAAVTRRRPDGYPGPTGWYGEQRLTVAEAVRAYTTGGAYAGGEEAVKGRLAPGLLADLVVLDEDIFAIDPLAIGRVAVAATMVDGKVEYGSL